MIIMSEIKRKQIDQNVSQNSIWYISLDIPSELQRMVQSVKKIRKQEEKGPLLKSLQEFTTKQDIYSKHMIYWNIRSFLAGKIGDIQSVAICTERLLSFGKDSFCANYSSCLNNLYTLHNYSEAQRIAELLINNIEKYSINDYEKKDLYAAYMRSLIYLKKNEDILNYTKKWSTEGVLRSTLGASRALAYKRIYEDSYNFEDKINNITKSIKIISDVYQVGGADKFVNSVIKEIYKVIIELIEDNHIVDNDILKLFLNFVFETSEILYPEGIDSYTNKLLSDVKCDENPFICNLVYDEEFDISEILNNDEYKKVEVYHIPDKDNTFPLYIFAKDHMEKQYFLRSDCCKNLDWNGWKKVKIGSFFYIKPCIVNEDCSKAAETSEIYIYKY